MNEEDTEAMDTCRIVSFSKTAKHMKICQLSSCGEFLDVHREKMSLIFVSCFCSTVECRYFYTFIAVATFFCDCTMHVCL